MKTTNWTRYETTAEVIEAIEERRHGEHRPNGHLSPAAEAKLRIDELLVFAITSGKTMGWTAANIVDDWAHIYWTGAPEYMLPTGNRRINVRMPDWEFSSTSQKAYLIEVAEHYVREILRCSVRTGVIQGSPSSEYLQIMRGKHYTDELREILKLTV